MDDAIQPGQPLGLQLQGPHWARLIQRNALDSTPLRLALPATGRSLEVNRTDLILGRHSGSDIRLPLPDVSRRHCRLAVHEGRWRIFDLDSLNGVFVNGERVQQAILHHRDVVQIGGYVFEVDLLAGDETVQLPINRGTAPVDPDEVIPEVIPYHKHRQAS